MSRDRQKGKHEPNRQKTIFEARYKPTLAFYDRLHQAAQKMTDYPHWATDRLSVTLRDPKTRSSLGISHARFCYDQDSADGDQEQRRIETALSILPEALDITEYVRLGLRRMYLVDADMTFAELASALNVKFLSQDDRLTKIMPHRVRDLQYVVDSEDDEFKYHIRLGPVTREEITRHIPFKTEDHLEPTTRDQDYREICEGYPDVAVFMDVDVYPSVSETPVNEALPFAGKASERIDGLVSGLRDYCFFLPGKAER